MKILTQVDIPYALAKTINTCMGKIGAVAIIKDMNELAKALNDYQPELLILNSNNIDGIVQAYKAKNNVKVISFGSKSEVADMAFEQDAYYPDLEAVNFKEDIQKNDISVFCSSPEHIFITQFLCQNYNVKAYGPIKINHPRYLGHMTTIDKYDILNKSKISINFNIEDVYSSVLLDTFPIIYSPVENNNLMTFQNVVSLVDRIESVPEENIIEETIQDQKLKIKSNNAFTFTIDILKKLGFESESLKLNTILEEIIQ